MTARKAKKKVARKAKPAKPETRILEPVKDLPLPQIDIDKPLKRSVWARVKGLFQ